MLLHYFPSELKPYVHTKTCTHMFLIAKTYKQSKCPSVGEWMNKLVHPSSGLLFSAEKK